MANHVRARLESVLRARNLDRTLTTALPPLDRADAASAVAFDVPALDARLNGGLPRGHVSQIVGPASSGRTTLLLQAVAGVVRRGEAAAVIDTCDRLDVSSAVAAGIDLGRLLWVRGQPISAGSPVSGPAGEAWDRSVGRALKALNLVLQAGGFGLVAIDLADVPPFSLSRIPFTTWLRLQRTIEGSQTACVLLAPTPLARSAGGLTLHLRGQAKWTEAAARNRITGLDVHVRIVSPWRGADAEIAVTAASADEYRAGAPCAQIGR